MKVFDEPVYWYKIQAEWHSSLFFTLLNDQVKYIECTLNEGYHLGGERNATPRM